MRSKLVFTILTFVILSICLYSQPVNAQTNQTTSRLQEAISVVQTAFNSVLDAEQAGADITSLQEQLNDAAGLLANAENAQRIGDYITAASDANSAISLSQQINASAQTAKEAAITNIQKTLLLSILVTIIVSFLFLVILLLVWRHFKRGYISRLHGVKPEVTCSC